MRHANSNLNILKKKRNSNIVKLNNFLKPPSSYKNLNSPLTKKNMKKGKLKLLKKIIQKMKKIYYYLQIQRNLILLT